MSQQVVCETSLPNRNPDISGKVRDIYDLGDKLLLVATDSISAFDWVNPIGVSRTRAHLTQISLWWFGQMKDMCRNHLISADISRFPGGISGTCRHLCGALHAGAQVPDAAGGVGGPRVSRWQRPEGIQTDPARCAASSCRTGLVESSKLEEPIYTPATKATDGHDINVSPEEAGRSLARKSTAKAADTAHCDLQAGP
jgi:phosphoribosylaminoimidazole-succinocarboxamide synthase